MDIFLLWDPLLIAHKLDLLQEEYNLCMKVGTIPACICTYGCTCEATSQKSRYQVFVLKTTPIKQCHITKMERSDLKMKTSDLDDYF